MPSADDRFENEHCFIITIPSRGRFHLYGNDPDEIKIGDIANAISKQCRFTGHLQEDDWYSVAEHCCDVADIIGLMGGSKAEQFQGLMHDTPEGFLSDINAPFKREIGQYYEKEKLIWVRIAAKFGLPVELAPIVKRADWVALFIEAATFVVPNHQDILRSWIGWADYGHQSVVLGRMHKMTGLNHSQARRKFLAKFEELYVPAAAAA